MPKLLLKNVLQHTIEEKDIKKNKKKIFFNVFHLDDTNIKQKRTKIEFFTRVISLNKQSSSAHQQEKEIWVKKPKVKSFLFVYETVVF